MSSTIPPTAPRLQVHVWLDFVCPYCLLVKQPMAEAMAGLPVEVVWRPFELRPHPTPTLRPEGDYLRSVWAQSVYPLAKRLGVPLRLPAISPQPYTRLAFEGFQWAQDRGRADAYIDAMLRAFFQRELNIGRIDVLMQVVSEIGLPPAELESALAAGMYADRHGRALAHAASLGINSVPCVMVNGERIGGLLEPVHFRSRLVQLIDRVALASP